MVEILTNGLWLSDKTESWDAVASKNTFLQNFQYSRAHYIGFSSGAQNIYEVSRDKSLNNIFYKQIKILQNSEFMDHPNGIFSRDSDLSTTVVSPFIRPFVR